MQEQSSERRLWMRHHENERNFSWGGMRCPQRVDTQVRLCRQISCAVGGFIFHRLEDKPIHLFTHKVKRVVLNAFRSRKTARVQEIFHGVRRVGGERYM